MQKILSNTSLQKLQLLKNHLEQKSSATIKHTNKLTRWGSGLMKVISDTLNQNILKQKLLQKVINFKMYSSSQLDSNDFVLEHIHQSNNVYLMNRINYSELKTINVKELDLLKIQFVAAMRLNILESIAQEKIKEISEQFSKEQLNFNPESIKANQIKQIKQIKNQYIQHHKLSEQFIDTNGLIVFFGLRNIIDQINSQSDYFDTNNQKFINSYSIALPILENNIIPTQWQEAYKLKEDKFADLFDIIITHQNDQVILDDSTQDKQDALCVVSAILNGMKKLNVDKSFLQELELLSILKLKRVNLCQNKELEEFIKLSTQKNNRCTAHMLSKYFIDKSDLLVLNNQICSDTLLQKKQSINNAIEDLNQTLKPLETAHKEWNNLNFFSPLNCGLLECGGFIIGRLKLGAIFSFSTKFALLIICTIPLFVGRLVALKYYDHKIKNIKENLELKKNFFEKIEQELKSIQINNTKIKTLQSYN